MSQKRHLSTIVSFAALLAIGASAIQFRQGVPLEDFPLVEKVLGGDAEALQLDFVAEPLQVACPLPPSLCVSVLCRFAVSVCCVCSYRLVSETLQFLLRPS